MTFFLDLQVKVEMPVNIHHKYKASIEIKQKFGIKELLFDILVCLNSTVKHGNRTSDLIVITKCLWQVQSEHARNLDNLFSILTKLIDF